MYDFVRGQYCGLQGGAAVVEAAGLGFQIFVPAGTALPAVGEEVKLFVSYVVRDAGVALYGFRSVAERELFVALMGVSGVGPKMALALMGALGISELQRALDMGDAKALARAPGVGKRTAERLIVELKGKRFATVQTRPMGSTLLQDALSALINLGFSQSAARQALDKVLEGQENPPLLPSLIASALRHV